MRLDTSRFGVMEVDDGTVLTFTQPIIGFQEFRRFILLPGPPDSGVTWLQSTDAVDLAFILMDPRQVMPDYSVRLGSHELSELAVSDVNELDIYSLVVIPPDKSKMRTNLKAPILINRKHRLGKQAILDKSDYPVQFYLAQAKRENDAPREVSNARSNA